MANIGVLEAQLSGVKRWRLRSMTDWFRSLRRFLVFMAGGLAVDVYSTIRPQTSVKKGLFSSLHGLLISLRGLKKISTWSQVLDRKIGKDQQRSTFGEWIFTRRHISWPQITLFLNFSSRATFSSSFIHRIFKFTDLRFSLYSSNLWSCGHSFQTRGVKSMAHEAGQTPPPPPLKNVWGRY